MFYYKQKKTAIAAYPRTPFCHSRAMIWCVARGNIARTAP